MTDKASDDKRSGGDRRRSEDPEFKGPERRVGDRRAEEPKPKA